MWDKVDLNSYIAGVKRQILPTPGVKVDLNEFKIHFKTNQRKKINNYPHRFLNTIFFNHAFFMSGSSDQTW